MGPLQLLANPKKLLSIVTIAAAVLAGLYAFSQTNGKLPAAAILLLAVVLLAVLAMNKEGGKGWIWLLVSWAVAVIAYGALFPNGLSV
ncbi:hypothetical protein [Tenggerimyces flavus]|uniref:Uncharacterized protein n=1 Tax=Tenggerimyces flavus TaxID=1708749 RepID=A0ABV7YF42_9ACTN|nr:hypothetical protein [Tenggerimyces flavus]MBM7786051.1 hypothetical protein [Tenggerimyces flavus]